MLIVLLLNKIKLLVKSTKLYVLFCKIYYEDITI